MAQVNERIPENIPEQLRDLATLRGGRLLGWSQRSAGRRKERKSGSVSNPRQHSSIPVKVESFPALRVPKTRSHRHTHTQSDHSLNNLYP